MLFRVVFIATKMVHEVVPAAVAGSEWLGNDMLPFWFDLPLESI